jgi:hypothetical protein
MKNIILLLFLMVSTMAFSQEKTVEVPKIGVKIALGETVALNGVYLTFTEVLEDSRCPQNVECIWEGRVRVQLTINALEDEPSLQELIIGKTRPGESENRTIFKSSQMVIEGIAVTPYPQDTGQNLEYCLVVDVKKAD